MTADAELVQIVTDPRLTPEAVRVVLYVRSLGPVGQERAVSGEALSILLHGGEKPIRAAIARAVHCGYLGSKHGGRAGHKLTFVGAPVNASPQGGITEEPKPEMTPPGEDLPGNDSPRGGIPAPMGGGYMGGETPPINQPTNHPAGGRTNGPRPAELGGLREYLGEYAAAADVFAASAEHRGSWPAALLGKYGPNGTQQMFWRGVEPARQPAVVADALLNYASDRGGTPFDARLFEAFLRRARDGPPEKPARGRADVHPKSDSARIMERAADPSPGSNRVRQPARDSEPKQISIDPFARFRDALADLPAEEQETLRARARETAPNRAPNGYIEWLAWKLLQDSTTT